MKMPKDASGEYHGTFKNDLDTKGCMFKNVQTASYQVFSFTGTKRITNLPTKTPMDKLIGSLAAFGFPLVHKRIRHPGQKIQELVDGGLELTIQLSSLHEMELWELSWAEHVRVSGPSEFQKHVIQRLNVAIDGQ
jgi:hypothetical protein